MKIRNNREFGYFLCKEVFFLSGSFENIKTKRLQLYLLYPNSNGFGSGNKKVLVPTRTNKNLTFYIYKLTKVVIVSKNKNLIFVTF